MNDTTNGAGDIDSVRALLERVKRGELQPVQFGAGVQQPANEVQQPANESAQTDLSGLSALCATEFEPVDEEPTQTAQQLRTAAVLAEQDGEHERAAELRAKAEVAPDNVEQIGTIADYDARNTAVLRELCMRYVILGGATLQIYDLHTGRALGRDFFINKTTDARTGYPMLEVPTAKSRAAWKAHCATKGARAPFVVETERLAAGSLFVSWPEARRVQTVVMTPTKFGREAEHDPVGEVLNRFPYIWENRPIKPTNRVVMKRTTPYDPRIKPLFDHLLFLAGGDEMAVCWFIYYLAHMYQNPGDKIPWAPLLCTVEKRMGKSCLVFVLADVFGGRASKLVSQTTGPQFKRALVRGFTESLDKCWIKFINELPSIRDPEVMDHLKSVITDRGGEAEHKGEGAGDIDRALQIIATTNNVDALPQITSFGRFLVLGTDEKPRPPEYYAQFLAWAGDEGHTGPGAQALADVLWEMEFPPEWKPKAPPPVTDFARQMDSQSLSEGALFVQRLIAQREEPFKKDFQHGVAADDAWMADEIRSKVANSRYGMSPPEWAVKLDSKKLGRILAELGCERLNKRASKDKNDHKPRCWRNLEQWNQRSADEMRQHLEDGNRPFEEP